MAEARRGRGNARLVLLHEWTLELWGPATLGDDEVERLSGEVLDRLESLSEVVLELDGARAAELRVLR